MQSRPIDLCVLCAIRPVVNRAHIPGKLFFSQPLPSNLITVPSCSDCNQGLQHHEEYLRTWLMLLRGGKTNAAVERVRERASRHLMRAHKVRDGIHASSELRPEVDETGQIQLGLYTRPDRSQLWSVLTTYARGLHYWATGDTLSPDIVPSIERIFNRGTRPEEYWKLLLSGEAYARGGNVTTIGTNGEFQLSFRRIDGGDALSVMVMDFYNAFPYVAMLMRPGTDFAKARLPF